jgi:Zn-finger nucleic acid-binding protein
MSTSLGITVLCLVLFLLVLFVYIKLKKNKSLKGSTETHIGEVTQELTSMEKEPDIQDEILSKISKLETDLSNLAKSTRDLSKISKLETDLSNLAKSTHYFTNIKSQLDQVRSFAGCDLLFCPETDEPMRRISIEGEDIDISQAGCWFDSGELLSILDRSDSFISKLKNIFNDSSISKIEKSISKEKEIESRKKIVANLYSEFIRTNSPALKNKISTHNERLRYLIYGASQGTSSPVSNSSQPSASNLEKTSVYQHGTAFSSSTSPTDSKFTHSPQSSGLKCPASNSPMTRLNVEGIELDVSPFGVWFDGSENLGAIKPEILQVLEKKQNFFSVLFGSQSLAKIIEQKTVDVSQKHELDIKKLEAKRSIVAHSTNLSRISPESTEFSRQFIQLKLAIKSLEDLG